MSFSTNIRVLLLNVWSLESLVRYRWVGFGEDIRNLYGQEEEKIRLIKRSKSYKWWKKVNEKWMITWQINDKKILNIRGFFSIDDCLIYLLISSSFHCSWVTTHFCAPCPVIFCPCVCLMASYSIFEAYICMHEYILAISIEQYWNLSS